MAGSTAVHVRFWAAARAAAGTAEQDVELPAGATVGDLVASLGDDRPALARVLAVCSVLVGEQPVGAAVGNSTPLEEGATVELLPPFAGG